MLDTKVRYYITAILNVNNSIGLASFNNVIYDIAYQSHFHRYFE